MHILEIINEAPVQVTPTPGGGGTTPAGVIIPPGSRTAAPVPNARTRASAATSAVAGKFGKMRSSASWTKAKGLIKKRLYPDHIILRNGKTIDITNPANLTGILGNNVARGLTGISSIMLKIFKWIGFINFVYQWYGTKAIIADMASGPTPEISPDEKEVFERLALEELVAEMAASEIMVRFITWIIRLFKMGRAAEYIAGAVVGFFSGGTLVAAEVAFFLAQEALLIAIQNWLQTKEGKELIASIVISAIDPALSWLHDETVGQFTGKWKQLTSEESKEKAQKTLSTPTQTATGKISGQTAPNADPRSGNQDVVVGPGDKANPNYEPGDKDKAYQKRLSGASGISDADYNAALRRANAGR